MGRKLDVGATLSEAFSIYKQQLGVLIPLALGFYLVVAVVNGLLAATLFLLPLTLAVSVIASTLFSGTVVQLVRDVQDGSRDKSAGELISSVTPVLLPLILVGLLGGIAIGIGFLLLIIPGLFLLTIWAVIAPVVVVERSGVFAAFGRSRELVRGSGWQVFGVILVVFLIIVVVRAILGAIAVGIEDTALLRIIFDLIGSAITAPVAALVAAVIYFRLTALEKAPVPGDEAVAPPPDAPPAGA